MKKNAASLILGFFLILIGLSIFFDNFGIFNFTSYIFKLWPLLLVYWGIKQIIKGATFWGLILLSLGVIIIVNNFNLISFNLFLAFWPALIIVAGLNVIIKAFIKPSPATTETTNSETSDACCSDATVNEVTVLSDHKKKFATDDFKGGSAVTILGSTKLDIANCKTKGKDVVLEVVAVLGDTHVYLPSSMNIKVESVPVLGSVEDHRKEMNASKEQGALTLKAVAVLGAIHIH